MIGNEIYELVKKIFPICRSITGNGNRQTLREIQNHIPIAVHEVPTGYQAYDWKVPQEWNINSAYVIDPDGKKIIDFEDSNLHVMNYSIPVDEEIDLEDLQAHLYSIPENPDAIPYVTSYYERRWGFCLRDSQRKSLKKGKYRVLIDSSIKDGSLTYGEFLIPGDSDKEILLTTYICHPSMANNECSGPSVVTFLCKWLMNRENRYSYRIVFAPETIGAIVYISKNYDALVNNVVAGFNVTCVGDNNGYSFMPSRLGNTLADKVAEHVLNNFVSSYDRHSFLFKGSDERQYCHPKVDLPLVSVMRTKYGAYPEYHTSLDDLSFVSPEGLNGGFNIIKKCIEALEVNNFYENSIICEPKMSERGLRPKNWHKRRAGAKGSMRKNVRDMMNILFYCDGHHDLIDLSNKVNLSFEECYEHINLLEERGVLECKA